MDGDLIQLVNKLQDTFANLGGELDMPQIAVVGSQSAGKSSVLETIVGRDFLPRGQGIVTRRPLVLQLIHTPEPATEYGQFLHTDKRFTDFADIRREIEAETFRVAGQNKGVSKLPISLRIYSPQVLNLTLVDLPGLTKIPVGDQPSDIERQIRNLILDFITKPNCVILAVSPANVDLANSDSLKLARSVDPQGKRTIGVLTKLDLMDAGTHALDILTGRVYPLKLGFIGVVNRSQQDINTERSMEDARANEARFFKEHLAYRNVAHRQGTAYLAKTLNQVLINHIREKLPDMKARLNTLMGQTQHELNAFGDATMFGDDHQKGALILRLMTSFARDFVSSIEGTNLDISTKELSGGARIYYIFNDVFGHALGSLDATGNLTTQDIRTAIRNSHGPRPSMFVPELAFDLLVKPQIKLLEMPSLRCVELVYEELVKICHNCTSKELTRFPKLHTELIETVSELLKERLGPTSDYTQSLIDIQVAYINTNHPSFMRGEGMMGANGLVGDKKKTKKVEKVIRGPINTDVTSDDVDEQGDLITPSGPTPPPNPLRSKPGNNDLAKHSDPETTSNAGRRHREKPRRASSVAGSDVASGPKDTFLGYFFGGQPPQPGTMTPSGPGGSKIVGATTAALLGPRHERMIGRDTMSESGAPPSSFETRRSLESQNAAFDMKSLGRHIEAVPAEGDLSSSQRDEWETGLIRSLIQSYFGIVRQTIQDIVPKAIMHLLVNHTCQQVQNRLVSTMYRPDKFDSLLHEDENLVAERARVKALLDAYKEAFKTLSEVSLNA